VDNREKSTIVWLRRDLRLADNPALEAALSLGRPVIPVFIESLGDGLPWPPGAASRWWLHQSLAALDVSLRARGSRLILRSGPAARCLRELAVECAATHVFWNRSYEPEAMARDAALKPEMNSSGLETANFNGSLLFEPASVLGNRGKPYRVFTPFWRACLSSPAQPHAPGRPCRSIPAPRRWPRSLPLQELRLEPVPDWAGGLRRAWKPGEKGAHFRLEQFIRKALPGYPADREFPGIPGTSRLSPHLHFGEISPHAVWHVIRAATAESDDLNLHRAGDAFLRQLGWREFAYHILAAVPGADCQPLRPEFRSFPWRQSARELRAWQHGRTGYPIVDAGMRELWATQNGSGIRSWMPIWPTTRLDGSGLRAAVRTQHPISASSILSARERNSTPGVNMSAIGCRSWPGCQRPGFTSRGKRRPPCSPARGSGWVKTTQGRWSTMRRPVSGPWPLIKNSVSRRAGPAIVPEAGLTARARMELPRENDLQGEGEK
jgi:deoxyribodipyrimidine photo-lyase